MRYIKQPAHLFAVTPLHVMRSVCMPIGIMLCRIINGLCLIAFNQLLYAVLRVRIQLLCSG